MIRLAAGLMLLVLPCLSQHQETVTLPNSAADLANGKKLFGGSCGYCHGPAGAGGTGADLSRPQLVHAPTDSDLVNVIRWGIPGTEMPGAYHLTQKEVTQVAAFIRSLARVEMMQKVPGDAARGKALFQRSACGNCHTVKQNGVREGGFAGPDLSSMGLLRSPAQLRESIMKPAAVVPEEYLPVHVVTKTGAKISGTHVYEDTFVVVVRDASTVNHTVLKTDVASIQLDRKSSPMPSYDKSLSAAELDDVIAYLISLKEPL